MREATWSTRSLAKVFEVMEETGHCKEGEKIFQAEDMAKHRGDKEEPCAPRS